MRKKNVTDIAQVNNIECTHMIASLIGMGVSLAASGWKAVQESRLNKRMMRERDAEYNKNKAETNGRYAQRYYENPLTRADNQALLNHQKQMLQEANRKTTATAAITGATPEAIQAQKNASANQYASTVSSIAANNEERKDKIWSNWEKTRGTMRKEFLENRDADYERKLGNIGKFGELAGQLGTTAANAFANSGAENRVSKNAVAQANSSVDGVPQGFNSKVKSSLSRDTDITDANSIAKKINRR